MWARNRARGSRTEVTLEVQMFCMELQCDVLRTARSAIGRAAGVGKVVTVCAALAAGCSQQSPTAPSRSGAANVSGMLAATPATPPFHLEAVLRGVNDGPGFGLVKFPQPSDADLAVYLDAWVRDLSPNTAYELQRAV